MVKDSHCANPGLTERKGRVRGEGHMYKYGGRAQLGAHLIKLLTSCSSRTSKSCQTKFEKLCPHLMVINFDFL